MKKTIIFFELFILLFFGACTNIHIHKSDGEVSVFSRLGIVVVDVRPGDNTMIIETNALGISKAVDAYNIGYLDEVVVFAGNDCRLIIFEPKLAEIQSLFEMIGEPDSICVLDNNRRIK